VRQRAREGASDEQILEEVNRRLDRGLFEIDEDLALEDIRYLESLPSEASPLDDCAQWFNYRICPVGKFSKMESTRDNQINETWDRLVLLLISRPREGWEPEFEDITRREIERLKFPALAVECENDE
jgi:hypothetical protein